MSATESFIRMRNLIGKTGMSKTTIYREVKAGRFPKPIQLSASAVGWRESDIAAWMASLPTADGTARAEIRSKIAKTAKPDQSVTANDKVIPAKNPKPVNARKTAQGAAGNVGAGNAKAGTIKPKARPSKADKGARA